MAEIINTLYGRPVTNWPAPSAYQSFTVNTAVRKVSVDLVSVPQWRYTFGLEVMGLTGQFAYKFAKTDKFRILSFGILMPHGLQFANEGGDVPPILYVGGNSNLGVPYFFDQVSYMHVPWGEYEVAADNFVDWSNAPTAATWLSIEGQLYSGQVSMVGVNAALNGQVFYTIPYVKVLHNLPLST